MPVILASDLKGQLIKESLKKLLGNNGCDIFDVGFVSESNIEKVGKIVHDYPDWVAVVFCDNATCLSLSLNQHYTNVKSFVANANEHDLFTARHRYRANVMCFPMNCAHQAINLVTSFLTA